jgi:radical SAM protein (TIGR01212 family)
VGLVIGTRPDCLSQAVLDLWYEYSKKTYVAVEFGVQSFDDDQLVWMRRGHTASQALKAIEKTAALQTINVGIHLIFGWPTETDKQIVQTARLCNDLPIQNVKLHNLHVLKNTGLEEIYRRGEFIPIERDEYARRVALFLDHLNPRLAVHRLAAVASQWDELIAPTWTRDKMRSFQALLDYLNETGSYQGRLYS